MLKDLISRISFLCPGYCIFFEAGIIWLSLVVLFQDRKGPSQTDLNCILLEYVIGVGWIVPGQLLDKTQDFRYFMLAQQIQDTQRSRYKRSNVSVLPRNSG